MDPGDLRALGYGEIRVTPTLALSSRLQAQAYEWKSCSRAKKVIVQEEQSMESNIMPKS